MSTRPLQTGARAARLELPADGRQALRAVTSPPTIRMFGPLTVSIGGRTLAARELGGAKPRHVLGVLLCARGRPVAKDRLCELLWDDGAPRNPSAALENYIFVLRRALTADGLPPLVVTEPKAYRFATELVDVDLDRFDALVAAARRGEPAEARPALEEALSLATGELLEDERYAGWAEELRAAYAGVVEQVRVDAAEAALTDRDLRSALAHAEGAIAADAYNERAYRTAMLALYGLGRQHHALETFKRCRTVLTQELGIEPLHETKLVHAAILRQDDIETVLAQPPAPAAAAPAPATERSNFLAPLTQMQGAGNGPSIVVAKLSSNATAGTIPLVAAIREALGEAASGVGGVDGILRLLAGRAPMILIIDGLDGTDAAAVQALEELEHGCHGTGIAIVARYRSDEPLDRDPLQRLNPAASAQVGRSRLVVAGDPLRSALASAMVSLAFLAPVISLLADVFDDLT